MRWRPFYWDDLGCDWRYRFAVSAAFVCFAFVAVMFLAFVVLGVYEATR